MRAWPAPSPSGALAGRFGPAPPLRLYDTARKSLVDTGSGGSVRLYVCGITPYDATHVGHAATYVAFDLAVRAWLDAGAAVQYVQNVTDVDDPLLERAEQTGEDWRALAERETATFRDDMTALRLIPPAHFVGAVEAIPMVVETITLLAERGAVYEVDGDWYFPVAAAGSFGSVAGLPRPAMTDLFRERGGDPDRAGKKDPLDCLVWQRERAGEPSWDSPLGRGRPGWHIECTAIVSGYLGRTIDVQGGGSDLAFPHHEMCAAQGHVAWGEAFARAYVHAGMVGLDGEKMSKSRGNLVFVSELRQQGHDPMAIRLALLAHHYRRDWQWDGADLANATARLHRWRRAVAAGDGPPAKALVAAVRSALAGDLDAPAALSLVDDWAEAALAERRADGSAGREVAELCDERLGVAL